MEKNKWAIVVDSGSDLNDAVMFGKHITKLPLRVTMEGKTYSEEELSFDEVFSAMDQGPVTTSLPSGKDIIECFESLEKEGVKQILVVTISSGLSGTYNVINTLKDDYKHLEIEVIDTLNISMGSGLLALWAHELLSMGLPFNEVVSKVKSKISVSKVYFTCGDLEYLRRGGRLGLVAGSLANILNLKPVISCNPDGVYYTVAKVRGYKKSIKKMIDLVCEDAKGYCEVMLAFLNADSKEDVQAIQNELKARIPQCKLFFETKVSTGLAIHVGPEAMGVAILGIN